MSSLPFFFNATATTEIYTLSLHDALPIWRVGLLAWRAPSVTSAGLLRRCCSTMIADRKSTRLNSSHLGISYAVFCLKKKRSNQERPDTDFEHAHDMRGVDRLSSDHAYIVW